MNDQRLKDIFKTKEEFEEILHLAYEHAKYGFETEFVRDTGTKYEKFGMQMFFSPKQEKTLFNIAYPKVKK